MRVTTDKLFAARLRGQLGAIMSVTNNNGNHSANGITAMFIATGQDVANVAESSAAFVYAELRENGDYYYSVTIPSLIVATYGGGTGLPTQRECLELLGCYGTGKVRKLAEIVAATVLCGELSLGSAIVAEAVIPNDLVKRIMRSDTELMFKARQVSNLGGFMSGVNNNGAHSANGITAMFIATGQDAANVAESSAAFVYAELRDNGDYYYSVTIPSLIVATYGGGTALATQRECLELLGCYGKGQVRKFTEIVAATVLCGELSLGSAIVAEEWVNAHDLLGRNRPG
jgi:hydroxymethylglutaryl-CoA reductase